MPTPIDHHEVQRLLVEEQAQLVEVLPAGEFADEHLPGAISIPLKQLDRERAQQLDRNRPVIVYCHDSPVRHEPTSRVAVREHRVRAGLRLRRRQGRLGGPRKRSAFISLLVDSTEHLPATEGLDRSRFNGKRRNGLNRSSPWDCRLSGESVGIGSWSSWRFGGLRVDVPGLAALEPPG